MFVLITQQNVNYILLSTALNQTREEKYETLNQSSDLSLSDIKNQIEESIINRLQNPIQELKTEKKDYSEIINTVVGIIISCVSAYLAWTCNSRMAIGKRVSMTILAFLFGMFYLLLLQCVRMTQTLLQ